jgi:hypothetical protein
MGVFGKASMGKEDTMSAHVVIEGRWCLTEDSDRIVPEGSSEARWLWAVDGAEMPQAECERVGYGVKQAPAPTANKRLRRSSENK